MFRNDFNETLYKEHDNEKLSKMFGRFFCRIVCKKTNVKMEKTGGGGLDVTES
jgi:hypothetical protein